MGCPTDGMLANSMSEAIQIFRTIKSTSQAAITATAARNVPRSRVLKEIDTLARNKIRLTAIRNLPGLDAYAQAQFSVNPDILVSMDALINQLTATLGWAATNFPQSNGYALATQINANGTTSDGIFTPTQTAGLRTVLQDVVNAID